VTARPAPAMMFSVYDGQTCLGFIFCRGSKGFEAFDRDEKSLGLFQAAKQAATAVMKAAVSVLP